MTSLLIKQGLGRLIRDFKDKGVAIIGDKRIKQKFYGKHILNSLPPYYLMDDYNGVLKFIESMK
jgi:ATP-dependent DNA helicase DinG